MRRLLVVVIAFALGLALVEVGLRAFAERWMHEHGRGPGEEVAAGGVLCTGDSVTFGSYVGAEEAWPACLGRLLSERAGDARPVLNVAIPGTSADRVARELPRQLDRYQPSVVVVLCGHNNSWLDAGPLPRAGFFAELRIVKFAKLVFASSTRPAPPSGDYLETEGPVDMLRFRGNGERVPDGRLYRVQNRAGERVEMFQPKRQLADAELESAICTRIAEVARTCRERGVRLLLLTYPPASPSLLATNRTIRRAAADSGAEFLDVDAALAPLLAGIPSERLRFPDGHPRAPVYELLAQCVYGALRARGWIAGPDVASPAIEELFPTELARPRSLRREGDALVVEGRVGDGVRILLREGAADPPLDPELLRLRPARLAKETGWHQAGLFSIGPTGRLVLPFSEIDRVRLASSADRAIAIFVPQTHPDIVLASSEQVEIEARADPMR